MRINCGLPDMCSVDLFAGSGIDAGNPLPANRVNTLFYRYYRGNHSVRHWIVVIMRDDIRGTGVSGNLWREDFQDEFSGK